MLDRFRHRASAQTVADPPEQTRPMAPREHDHDEPEHASAPEPHEPRITRPWTAREDRLVLAHDRPDADLARVINRTPKAIGARRWSLKRDMRIRSEPRTRTRTRGSGSGSKTVAKAVQRR